MDLAGFLNSSIAAWALVVLLMVFLAFMTLSRRSRIIKDQTAIFVIVLVLLLGLIALAVNTP